MKKKIALLLSLLAAVLFCFGLAACKQKGVTLKDFPETETQTVALGSVYELKTQAEGEDGNTYRLTFQVRTRDDAAVPVFDDRFDVTDIGGYVITYTAVTDGVTQTSVITLDVTDDTAPTISISKPENGSVGEEYALPVITVSDLAGTSPEVTVKVYLIREGERTEITSLSERGGRYYFTPESVGTYEIEVTAVKTNGQSKTATRSFNIDEPVAEGEVFSPEVVSPESQISFVAAGGVETDKLIVETAEETQAGSAYTGRYLSVNGKDIGENVWVDIHLTPRLAIEDYADFDVVEFWVYFQTTSDRVKIGILGGSTAASDPLLREFAGNTWAKVSVDADTFFDLIDSKRLFTVNFNNPASGNHAGVQEVRIGSVTAKYAFAPAVTVDAPAADTDEESAVTLTVDTDAAFTARIQDQAGEEVPCTVEGNVVRANLPMGTYTYTLTSEDSSYVGSFSGTFTVEGTTQIVLPEAESGIAGKEYTIPDALISVNGEVQEGIRAECKATFVQGLNGKASENVLGSFTPLTFGTLTLSYTYEGAAPKTMTVEIAPAQAEGSVLFDPSTATDSNIDSNRSEQKFTAKPGDPSEEYTGSYLELTAEGYTEWANTRLKLDLNKDSYAEYDKIGVWVYFEAQGTVTNSLFNEDAYKTQYAANRWHLILVDREAFIEKMIAAPDLLAIRFNTSGGNFPGLTEVRLGAIVALHSFDEAEVSVSGTVDLGENADVTFTIGEEASDITVKITDKNGETTTYAAANGTVTVQLPVGNYTYEITTADPTYTGTIEGTFAVESKVKIVLPEAENGVAGEEYTIPDATVTIDGVEKPDAEIGISATFVQGLNGAKTENVTGSFTPLTAGTLTIVYSYEGAASVTLTVEIAPAEPKGNVIFDASTATADNLTSTNGSLHIAVADGEGNYISVKPASNASVWSNLELHIDDVSAFAEYDVISFRVYFVTTSKTVKIGILGGSTGDTDPLLRTFPGNTWATVTVDAETFFDLIGSKMLFPVNFNSPTSPNHANVTEVRLGAIVGLYELDNATVPEGLYAAEEGTTKVVLTVNQDATDISAVIKDANEIEQICTVSGSTITADLPVGVYTFEITTSDPRYTGKITGSFTVESSIQIVEPELPKSGTALEAFTIPQAQIKQNGELTENTAICTAVFQPTYNSDGTAGTETTVSGTFTPSSSGTLTITYTYEGALEKVFTVTIGRAEKPENVLLDLRNNDVLADVKMNDTATSVSYHDTGKYLVWTGEGNWKQLKINFGSDAAGRLSGYKYLKVEVYYQTDGATGNVTGWFCAGGLKIGTIDNEAGKLRQIPHDTWYTVYIPTDKLNNNILAGASDFLQAGFGLADGGHFPKVQEVRLKGFELVTDPQDTTFIDLSGASAVDQFTTKPSDTFNYIAATDTERAYLSWKGLGTWQSLYFNPSVRPNCNVETTYEYIAVELYYVSGNSGETDVTGYFLHGKHLIGNGNNGADIGLETNEWVTVYLPVDVFYSSNAAAGTGYLLQCSFNQAGNGHFPGVTEVRIGNIFFTNENA